MIILILIIAATFVGVLLFMKTPRFGKNPSGKRLLRIKKSSHYKNGEFKNLSPTPMLAEGINYGNLLFDFLFSARPKEPKNILPSKKTDLKKLNPLDNVIIWMGHSSYFMQLEGKKILVDPVMSGNASPVFFNIKAFKGSDVYTTDDIPDIDYLFITHDHWDHMDKKTLIKLKPKIKKIFCGLGNGEHLEYWGFDPSVIFEGDWYENIYSHEGFSVNITPSRHFSGRGLIRNRTLWASFALFTPKRKIYIGGDSGYGKHFADIGEKYGSFDMAILENGQYNEKWKYIHMTPVETVKAAIDLKAKTILPVHSGKFTLGHHDWDEPLSKITKIPLSDNMRIITPMIGEKVNMDDSNQQFTHWWEGVE